jgi:hypothetical protein
MLVVLALLVKVTQAVLAQAETLLVAVAEGAQELLVLMVLLEVWAMAVLVLHLLFLVQ